MSDQTEREAEAELSKAVAMLRTAYADIEKISRRMWDAEARVRELEGVAQQLRDAYQGEVEKVARVEALADEWRGLARFGGSGLWLDHADSIQAALRGES